MIKIIKTFTIFFLVIIMISCKYKNENTTKFNSFKKIYKLKGISPRKENNDVPSSMIVGMTDSLIILNDVSNNKSCLHIFTRQRLDYLLSSGKIGKGPKEITRAGIAFLNFKKTAIYVMDIGKYKLFKFNLNQLLKKRKEYKPIIVASIPKSFMPITQIQHYKNHFFMSGKFGNNLIAKIGLDGKLIEKIGNKSYNIKNKPTIGYSQATNINFDLNEKQKKIAIGYLHFDKIEILNLNGQKNKIIIGPDQLKPKFKYKGQTLSNKNLKKAYYDIESNDEYIYALYSGKYGINRQKGQYVYNYPAIIHKFDWEGNPIAKYILDKQIIEFEIDFNRDQIIALDAETDNTFITYNLHNK